MTKDIPALSIPNIAFGQRRIGVDQPVVTIAEIGINHEGDVSVCARMIEEAAKADADAIKLQTIDANENYVVGTESHRIFSCSALDREETNRMFELARSLGLEVFTTTGDFLTLEWVDKLEPAAHKISSGLLTNLPLVKRAAKTGRSLLISTGAATIEDIQESIDTARDAGTEGIALFQCTSLYPAPPDCANLANIGWLSARFSVPTGFSDHTLGWEAAMLSVGAGACMIEKHFTLDRNRDGYDHHLSLEPSEFATLVGKVREAEILLGSAGKHLSEAEQSKASELHRVLVARQSITVGETFSAMNLGIKRPLPGKPGLAPRLYESVLGRTAKHDLRADDPVTADAVEGLD